MDDQARALLIVGALLSGASGSLGYAGGRWSAPAPEIRFVHVPVPSIVAPVEVAPAAEPPHATLPVDPQPAPADPSPPAVSAPVAVHDVEAKPLPRPRPKVEARPKPERKKEAQARRPVRALPSCAVIKREYDAMSWPERMAAYRKATPEEIAQGKRCLGFLTR